MDTKLSEAMECRVVGRLGREPEASSTMGGATVCRLVVVKPAAGPTSSPVRVGLYITGTLAMRCRRALHEGDLIEAFGELGARPAGSKARSQFPEVIVQDSPDRVKLKERAGEAA